eukprot:scaffold17334_cov57-Cyclotella_meneghiniana.AAC.1
MSPRAVAPTSPSIVEAFVMVLVGFGVVWGGWGRYLEAADHGRGGGCVVCWAKNGEKRALSSKNLKSAPMVFKSIGTLVEAATNCRIVTGSSTMNVQYEVAENQPELSPSNSDLSPICQRAVFKNIISLNNFLRDEYTGYWIWITADEFENNLPIVTTTKHYLLIYQ